MLRSAKVYAAFSVANRSVLPHSLADRDVPRTGGRAGGEGEGLAFDDDLALLFDEVYAAGFPEGLFFHVGAGVVAARYEEGAGGIDSSQGFRRVLHAADPRWGRDAGPMITKSLYMTGVRLTPNPWATNSSSRVGACTRTTSTLPSRAS